MGTRMRVLKGLSAISRLCNIDIVPMVCLRDSLYTRKLIVHEPLPRSAVDLNADQQSEQVMGAAFKVLE